MPAAEWGPSRREALALKTALRRSLLLSAAKSYGFVSWSDAGAPTHDITVPATNTTYTAAFKRNR